jgi:hypothetical protein
MPTNKPLQQVPLSLPPEADAAQKPVYSHNNVAFGQFGNDSAGVRSAFGSDSLKQNLLKIQQRQGQDNQACQKIMAELLADPALAEQLQDTLTDMQELDRYMTALDALLAEFQAGAAVKTTVLIDKVSKNLEEKPTFLRDKVKPMLELCGFLVKKEDNSFKWASLSELQKMRENVQQVCNSCVTRATECATGRATPATECATERVTVQQLSLLKKVQKWMIERDPYKKSNDDGSVKKIKKPYKGKLTEREKEQKRQADRAKAEYKMQQKKLKYKKKLNELKNQEIGEGEPSEAQQQEQRHKAAKKESQTTAFILVILMSFALFAIVTN